MVGCASGCFSFLSGSQGSDRSLAAKSLHESKAESVNVEDRTDAAKITGAACSSPVAARAQSQDTVSTGCPSEDVYITPGGSPLTESECTRPRPLELQDTRWKANPSAPAFVPMESAPSPAPSPKAVISLQDALGPLPEPKSPQASTRLSLQEALGDLTEMKTPEPSTRSRSDSPRSTILAMCGAWHALGAGEAAVLPPPPPPPPLTPETKSTDKVPSKSPTSAEKAPARRGNKKASQWLLPQAPELKLQEKQFQEEQENWQQQQMAYLALMNLQMQADAHYAAGFPMDAGIPQFWPMQNSMPWPEHNVANAHLMQHWGQAGSGPESSQVTLAEYFAATQAAQR